MTHLYLIRHGHHIGLVENILSDQGLSARGITQAERLRDRLAATGETKAGVLISSTMPRARQTAEIIAPALGLPIILDDEVQEWRNDEPEPISLDDFLDEYRSTASDQRPFFQMVPGAESWVQFMLRAGIALNRITQDHMGRNIVIVTHGGIIEASFAFFFGLSTLQRPQADLNPYYT